MIGELGYDAWVWVCRNIAPILVPILYDYPGIFPFFSPGIVLSATLMLSGLRRGFNEKNAELCGMSVRFLDRNTSDFDVHRGV